MARRGVARPGSRWQPIMAERPVRAAGRRRPWRLPRFELPEITPRARRVAAFVAVAAALAVGAVWLYHSPALAIRGVSVEGNGALSADVVRAAAGLQGKALFQADFGAARERIEALPLVKSAEVSRDWPFGVSVVVVERRPWGVWEAGGQRYVIDNEAVVLDLPVPAGVPVIVQTDAAAEPISPGERVPESAVAASARLAAEAERALGRPVERLEFSHASGLTAVLAGDLQVAFGDVQGYEFKIAALFAVLQQAEQEGRTLRRVDLRFGDRVAVQ